MRAGCVGAPHGVGPERVNGKKGTAPCGHAGEHVIGQYVRCPICDPRAGTPSAALANLLACEGTEPSSGLHDYTIKRYDPHNLATVWICKICGLEYRL